ncbi:hypothetical protein SUDANB95_02610 [Actinosynnema sp. ALI-1.44]
MNAEDERPPVPPVRPDPDLVWQVEGDAPTIDRYRAATSEVAEPDQEDA